MESKSENAPRGTGQGWDPYEVWWTQVRAVQMARESKIDGSPPVLQPERRTRIRKAAFSEAARNVVLVVARMAASLKVAALSHVSQRSVR
jgi:hypothetical protein